MEQHFFVIHNVLQFFDCKASSARSEMPRISSRRAINFSFQFDSIVVAYCHQIRGGIRTIFKRQINHRCLFESLSLGRYRIKVLISFTWRLPKSHSYKAEAGCHYGPDPLLLSSCYNNLPCTQARQFDSLRI